MTDNSRRDEKFKPLDGASSLAVALAYLRSHPTRYIFPIKAGAKFPPLVQDNLATNASNDPEQITKQSKKFPGCNWGVAHKKSRLMVVDVDTNAAKGKQGQQTFDAIALAYDWPETERTETPSGGFHLVYEGEHIMALGENGIGKDIDSPNYTVIPGCTFKDGTSYTGNGADAVACPSWIYEIIKDSKSKARITDAADVVVDYDKPENIAAAIDFLQNDAEPAIEGSGGDFNTLKTAMFLKDLAISPTLAVDLLNDYYNPRCEPPWERDGLEKKIANAYAYSSLSKVGGKTAEADFSDEPPEPPVEPMGDPKKIAKQKADREKRKAEKATRGKKRAWDTQCAIIVKPPAFVDIRRRNLLNKASFDNRFGGIGGEDAHCKAVRSKWIARYHGVGFKPVDVRSFKVDGQSVFNLFKPHKIEEMDGPPLIIIEHLRYLIPDVASRQHFVNWLAWLVQNPDKKLMHAALLLGKKGTGKSVIGELMKVILGAHNCSEPSRKRVASEFNGWLANKQLVIIHELREKGARGLYDELKEYITQGTTSINLKGIEAHEVDNFAAFLTITNHDDAIPIDDNERRYLVIRCADDPRFGKGTTASTAYYDQLFGCIGTSDEPGDEARKFLRFLRARDIKGYNGQGPAPETEAKADMVEAGQDSVQRFVRDRLEANEWPLGASIISPQDVLNELPFEVEKHLRTQKHIEAALREFGAKPLNDLGPLRTKTGRKRLWARDGSTVKQVCAEMGRAGAIRLYDLAVADRSASEEQADADEARAELAAE
ncbi:DUF5906 domain-containing protein [Bradyrhizobium sp. Ash2021]|uniref:DUF5906 domain-containing protein n=1 Tax=Bradyrhizobium sp. Ash2021 TaxID=2954771 RepID=UPI0028160254|nr:DUF5906 domain-containing protein [Bradyrhizobium sp. Ash2021]WMT75078.1 DUF5906 domain-containing protein [Bradyrhizobium sp. Ash2021]